MPSIEFENLVPMDRILAMQLFTRVADVGPDTVVDIIVFDRLVGLVEDGAQSTAHAAARWLWVPGIKEIPPDSLLTHSLSRYSFRTPWCSRGRPT
jgi:hypothetical protein